MQADDRAMGHSEERSRIDHRTGKRIFLHDVAFWTARVAERKRLGQTVHAYCTRRGLALSTFRRWARRLETEQPLAPGTKATRQAKFLEVPIVEYTGPSAAEAAIDIGLDGGVRVKLTGEAATRLIALVVSRVERATRT